MILISYLLSSLYFQRCSILSRCSSTSPHLPCPPRLCHLLATSPHPTHPLISSIVVVFLFKSRHVPVPVPFLVPVAVPILVLVLDPTSCPNLSRFRPPRPRPHGPPAIQAAPTTIHERKYVKRGVGHGGRGSLGWLPEGVGREDAELRGRGGPKKCTGAGGGKHDGCDDGEQGRTMVVMAAIIH